ncbi:MAG: hypothetical protein M3295_05955 [Chloroflexota bacterium]|nr:hypothetical protein [Chloroflexota bacterium]
MLQLVDELAHRGRPYRRSLRKRGQPRPALVEVGQDGAVFRPQAAMTSSVEAGEKFGVEMLVGVQQQRARVRFCRLSDDRLPNDATLPH